MRKLNNKNGSVSVLRENYVMKCAHMKKVIVNELEFHLAFAYFYS